MAQLEELNKAINALNDLWPLLDDEEKQKVIKERNSLNTKAAELANKALRDGAPELNAAIDELKLVTQSAKDAKESIGQVAERITKVANTIDKSVSAAVKVASLLAVL